jgi:signal transduction histidine kinase
MAFDAKSAALQLAALILAVAAFAAFGHGLPATALVCLLSCLFSASLVLGRRQARTVTAGETGIPPRVDRQQLLALLDLTPTPLVLRDGVRGFLAVNRAARELFRTNDAISDITVLAAAFERPPLDRQLVLNDVTYSLSLSDIEDGGPSSRRLGVLTNISAERRAAEASAMRDLFQVVNHELMNSLTPITSLSQTAVDLLADTGEENRDRARTAIGRVAERSSQLLHFAENYRALAKLPPPDPAPINPRPWLEGIVDITRARWTGTELRADFTDLPASLKIDAEQMSQALLNLLSNACEASQGIVLLSALRSGDHCLISIEDDGPGVAPDLQERVFLPFFTTKPTGSGIGLPLARQILAGHGADLRLDRSSDLGGARFSFRI